MSKKTVRRRSKFEIYEESDYEECPMCHGDYVYKNEMTVDDCCYETVRTCRCGRCGCEWEEHYEIQDIYITKKGKKCKRSKKR